MAISTNDEKEIPSLFAKAFASFSASGVRDTPTFRRFSASGRAGLPAPFFAFFMPDNNLFGKNNPLLLFPLYGGNLFYLYIFVSSKNPLPKKRKVGRPATGRTTRIIRASVPIWLDDEAKKAAFDTGESYSGFITRAVQTAILQLKSKP